MGPIKPELRSLYSVQMDMERDHPSDPEYFSLAVDAEIGPMGKKGADRFTFEVCTPRWLAGETATGRHVWGIHRLIVSHWDPEVIRLAVGGLCDRISGPDWDSVARQLAQYAQWEFDPLLA